MKTENSKKICSACGTSPVNHNVLFIYNLINETLGSLGGFFFNFSQSKNIANQAEIVINKFLSMMGFVRFNDDIEKATSGRSKLIWQEAQKRGIKMQQLVIWGKYIENYRAKINGKMYYFESIPIPPWFPQGGYGWIDDKFKLSKKLKKANINSPKTYTIHNIKNTKKNFHLLTKPVIIKPKNGSRGRHTTTNINTEKEAVEAFLLANKISPFLVIQEHLFGSVYRATVIDGKLVGFFRADPPFVTGNSKQNIEELILEKNKTKDEKLSEILINEELINFIGRENYNLKSVLPEGKTLYLIAKTGRMYGGYTKEMLPEVHPKMHEIFKEAGKVANVPVAGFDLIIEDPTKDPDTQRWGIIECNSLPFLDLHYFALEGKPLNLAENVWDLWNK